MYKVKKEREVFKELIHSENSFNYFQLMLKKDSLEYQIIHLKDIIYTQKKALEQEKIYLRSALESKEQQNKKRKLDDDDLPAPSTGDLYYNIN